MREQSTSATNETIWSIFLREAIICGLVNFNNCLNEIPNLIEVGAIKVYACVLLAVHYKIN